MYTYPIKIHEPGAIPYLLQLEGQLVDVQHKVVVRLSLSPLKKQLQLFLRCGCLATQDLIGLWDASKNFQDKAEATCMGVGGAEEQGLVGDLSGSTVTREADGFSD